MKIILDAYFHIKSAGVFLKTNIATFLTTEVPKIQREDYYYKTYIF